MRMTLPVLSVIAMVAACAPTSPPTTASSGRSSRNLLTQEQLAPTNSETLYDAIVKLRPEWLTDRGANSLTDATSSSASVYSAGTMLGKVESLRQLRVNDVVSVRYWDAGQASARFGMGHPRGVIEVVRE
jgi:hypothetical protein